MQNYLRDQPDNFNNINLVAEICIFLQSFYVDATKENISLINQAIQTLIEMSLVSRYIYIYIYIYMYVCIPVYDYSTNFSKTILC